MKRLPKDIKIHELLSRIRNFGPIYTSNISNQRCIPRGPMLFAGGKIVFFSARYARRFWWSAVRRRNLVVRGRRVTVVASTIRQGEVTMPGRFSRVIFIEGPREMVNSWYIGRHFRRAGFYWVTDEVIEHQLPVNNQQLNLVTLEWRFAEWRCQAQWAVHVLVHGEAFRGRVNVRYGHDPCAFPEGRVPSIPFRYETRATVPRFATRLQG